MTAQTSDNRYSVANWIVDAAGLSTGASHTTITAAIASASADDTIYVRPGTYTEDFTVDKSLKFMTGQARGNNSSSAIITGTVTLTAAQTTTFNGFAFNTNSATIISISDSNAIQLHFFNCNFFLSDGDCLTMDNANASVSFDACQFNQSADTLDIFNITDCAGVSFHYCRSFNGTAAGISAVAAGRVTLSYCKFQGQNFTTSTSGNFLISFCVVDNGASIGLTTAGTGTSFIKNSLFVSTTAAVISVGSGTTLNVQGLTVDSTNVNPVTGAGTINYGAIIFSNTGNGINVTTQTPAYTQLGKHRASGQPCFLAVPSGTLSNVTGNGAVYTIVFATERFDQNGNFDGTSTFTAPVTGRYQFSVGVHISGVTAAGTFLNSTLVTSNYSYQMAKRSGIAAAVDGGQLVVNGSVICDMDALDTATLTIQTGGEVSDLVDVLTGTGSGTYFSGCLLA